MTKVLIGANASAIFSNLPDLDIAVLVSQIPEADETVRSIVESYWRFF